MRWLERYLTESSLSLRLASVVAGFYPRCTCSVSSSIALSQTDFTKRGQPVSSVRIERL